MRLAQARVPRPTALLIIDDDEDFLYSMREYLAIEQPTWFVDTEHDHAKALARLQYVTYDVVVVDYQMPGMNGIEFLAEVRRLAPAAKRVLITARPDAELARPENLAADTDLILVKPIHTRPFVERVRALLAAGARKAGR